MRLIGLVLVSGLALSACKSPPPQQGNLVNANESDQAFASAASGNDIITGEDRRSGGFGNSSGAAAAPSTQQTQQSGQGQQGQQGQPTPQQ